MLKLQLYNRCKTYLEDRIKDAQSSVSDLQKDANNETKSSAGDKYETGREMMQQEINRELARLYELRKQKAALDLIDPVLQAATAQPGSIVSTDQGNYYLAVSAGSFLIEEQKYFTVSSSSPIGQRMLGLKQGDMFSFNGRDFRITRIH